MEAIGYFNKEYFLLKLQRAGVIKNDKGNDAHSLTLEKVPNVTIGLVLAVRSLKQFENHIILNWISKGKGVTALIEDQFVLYDKLSIYLQNNVYTEDDIEKWKKKLNETKYVFPESKNRGWAQIFGDTPILLDRVDSHESNIDLEGTELTVESPIKSENGSNNKNLEMTMASKETKESKEKRPHFSKYGIFLSDDICAIDNALDYECSIDLNTEIQEMKEDDMLDLSVKGELVDSQKSELRTLKISDPPSVAEIILPSKIPIIEPLLPDIAYCERTQSPLISKTFKVDGVEPVARIQNPPDTNENRTPHLKEYFDSGTIVEINTNLLLCTLCCITCPVNSITGHFAGKKHKGKKILNRNDRKIEEKVMSDHSMSGYFLYLNETQEQIKMDNPGISVEEIRKKAGELWNALEDKSKWLKLDSDDERKIKRSKLAQEHFTSNTDSSYSPGQEVYEERKIKRRKFVQKQMLSSEDSSDSLIQERKTKRQKYVRKRFMSNTDSTDSSGQDVDSDSDDACENSSSDSDDEERKIKRSRFKSGCFVSSGKEKLEWLNVNRKFDNGSDDKGRKSKRSKFKIGNFILSSKDSSNSAGKDDRSNSDGTGRSSHRGNSKKCSPVHDVCRYEWPVRQHQDPALPLEQALNSSCEEEQKRNTI